MNFNKLKKQKGFTIVELLIVIVVIGILAAITIVAYNGIQNRGKAAAGQALANSISKKAEAFNTIESVYPTQAQLVANTGSGAALNPNEAKLDSTAAVLAAHVTASSAVDGTRVGYVATSTGGCVSWWDFAASTAVVKYIRVGGGGAGC